MLERNGISLVMLRFKLKNHLETIKSTKKIKRFAQAVHVFFQEKKKEWCLQDDNGTNHVSLKLKERNLLETIELTKKIKRFVLVVIGA